MILPRQMMSGNLDLTCLLGLYTTLTYPPASQCFQTVSLSQATVAFAHPTQSIVPALSQYAKDVCEAPICTNETVTNILGQVGTCFGDVFGQFGIAQQDVVNFVPYLPSVKDAVCLANPSQADNSLGSENCVIQTMLDVQVALGQDITPQLLIDLARGTLQTSSLPLPALQTTVCTDCTKSIYTYLASIDSDTGLLTKGNLGTKLTGLLTTLCGADFVDGNTSPAVTFGTDINNVLPDAIPASA